MYGEKLLIQPGHVRAPYRRTNAETGKQEEFDPVQIFTSPSIVYASNPKYYARVDAGGFQVVFQMLQMPRSYGIGQQTFGKMADVSEIDTQIPNRQLEYYALSSDSMCIMGVLLRKLRKS
eukprot:m.238554 g.238554  ORF g.238554 m.238554 type:complete len:120 (-) comp26567_c0_seq1:84-443(-)